MDLIHIIFLAIVQGITEFLPISSSGHLVIVENLFHLNIDELKSFDIFLHAGTLLAIFCYFWKDVLKMLKSLINHHEKDGRMLIFYLFIGTLPAVFIGMCFEDYIDMFFRDEKIVFITLGILGALYVLVEKFKSKKIKEISVYIALGVGLAQAIALIPGVSRSGITIAAALLMGISMTKAARFSFLLGMPAILGAVIWTFLKGEFELLLSFDYLLGFFIAFLTGILTIHYLLKFLKSHTLNVFAVYLIIISLGGIYYLNMLG